MYCICMGLTLITVLMKTSMIDLVVILYIRTTSQVWGIETFILKGLCMKNLKFSVRK